MSEILGVRNHLLKWKSLEPLAGRKPQYSRASDS